jgi:starch phosphorylase
MVLADYASYADCQERVGQAFSEVETWSRMSILNVARSGKFSSDRSIREYCSDIWNVKPEPIRLLTPEEVKAGFLQ